MNTVLPTMYMILFSIIALTLIVQLFVLIWSIRYLARSKRDENTIKQLSVYNDLFQSTEDINKLLDSFIRETFNEYMVFHPELAQKPIITNDEQENIRKEVAIEIRQKMSTPFYSQLALIYREEEILNIILKKTTIILVDYCRNHNYNVNTIV